MKVRKVVVGLLLFGVVSWATDPSLSAEPGINLKRYKEQKTMPNAPALMEIYLKGVGDGFMVVNTELIANRKEQPLYCQPAERGLGGDNYITILENEILRRSWPDDALLSHILIRGLQNTFPCPK
jgi:hypothetical protein